MLLAGRKHTTSTPAVHGAGKNRTLLFARITLSTASCALSTFPAFFIWSVFEYTMAQTTFPPIEKNTRLGSYRSSERDCWDVDFEDDVGTVGSWLTREEHGLINIGYNFEVSTTPTGIQ